ncbi:MAG: NADH-quinone oxidoreductase subunit NuoE [Betaproteobacteria bacterium]|nr:NADH-quinone oxidoreductase subunit NuoE [Betaproteobacteria bacterium]
MSEAPVLSVESRARIDREVRKYPEDQRQSAVMSALAVVQAEHGHLTNELMDAVAAYLGMPSIAVYEVATFYTMYDLQPVGRHKLCVCTNLPCALSGANEAAEHLKSRLGIDWNQTTADGAITLKEGECFGACGDAPVIVQNNRKMLIEMTPAKIDELLAELSR